MIVAAQSMTGSVLQVRREVLRGQLPRYELAPNHPATQIGHQLQRIPGRSLSVSAFAQLPRELIEVCAQCALAQSQRRSRILVELFHTISFHEGVMPRKEIKLCRALSYHLQALIQPGAQTRHSPGLGIVPPIPHAE